MLSGPISALGSDPTSPAPPSRATAWGRARSWMGWTSRLTHQRAHARSVFAVALRRRRWTAFRRQCARTGRALRRPA